MIDNRLQRIFDIDYSFLALDENTDHNGINRAVIFTIDLHPRIEPEKPVESRELLGKFLIVRQDIYYW
ncbi:MAG: hypothetical protein ACETWQ_06275 [Phycisphaerae bacterium]